MNTPSRSPATFDELVKDGAMVFSINEVASVCRKIMSLDKGSGGLSKGKSKKLHGIMHLTKDTKKSA